MHNEVKNSQCEQLDFAERNTSHLKCNIFTGWRVLCAKIQMSDKLIEWLKKHLKFHSCIWHFHKRGFFSHPFQRTLSVKLLTLSLSISPSSMNSSLTLRSEVKLSFRNCWIHNLDKFTNWFEKLYFSICATCGKQIYGQPGQAAADSISLSWQTQHWF